MKRACQISWYSCIHHLGLGICFDENIYHVFSQEELAFRLYAFDFCEMIDDSAFGVITLVEITP